MVGDAKKKVTKVYKARHAEPGPMQLDYILLPIGYSYNSEWLSAKRGERIRLFDGGTYPIFSIKKIKIKSAAADILSRMRYGITIAGCVQRWKMNARLEGHTKSAVSDQECLWVIYEKREDDTEDGSDVQD